ncbi:WXG100 family type VII secretion target [Nocardia sp. NEAU-G5]|uniref:WXG100 family type VII secretion target n=1 Tax=Nocardia albiluteola TaxID=2842303 RepID=A0ABS6BBT3_9NOCA|nr:WXG100 family type VII secretion target [Nocardia albiluteola]MBU3067747.1 WXG100 family type VII secretion target [Nocardia albiluteola]
MTDVQVDYIEMHLSARQLSDWHQDSHQMFDSGHSAIEAATAAGWVGASRKAMEQALSHLRDNAAVLTGRLTGLSTRLEDAIRTYRGTDSGSGTAIARIVASGDRPFRL